jgi:hypothetical protein
MASTTAQPSSARGDRRHRSRPRRFLARVRPTTWRKIGAYLLIYAIAMIVVWRL